MTTGALSTEFSGEASLSYGSYNTNKQAVGISSGLLGGHWAVDARLTHIGSDGYIDRGATDLKSYLFQGGYYNGRTMVKLLSFGGKAKTYLTYNGVTMRTGSATAAATTTAASTRPRPARTYWPTDRTSAITTTRRTTICKSTTSSS